MLVFRLPVFAFGVAVSLSSEPAVDATFRSSVYPFLFVSIIQSIFFFGLVSRDNCIFVISKSHPSCICRGHRFLSPFADFRVCPRVVLQRDNCSINRRYVHEEHFVQIFFSGTFNICNSLSSRSCDGPIIAHNLVRVRSKVMENIEPASCAYRRTSVCQVATGADTSTLTNHVSCSHTLHIRICGFGHDCRYHTGNRLNDDVITSRGEHSHHVLIWERDWLDLRGKVHLLLTRR